MVIGIQKQNKENGKKILKRRETEIKYLIKIYKNQY